MDGLFPSPSFGAPNNYTFTLYTVNDGTKSVSLTWSIMSVPISYPPIVQVTNFADAQNIDPALDFTLRWSISGGSSLQILQLQILDLKSNIVFASPLPLTSNALNGTSTSFLIPANTLPSGADLVGHLTLAQPSLPNTNSYVGSVGLAVLNKDTMFPLHTRAAAIPPVLTVSNNPSGPFRFRVTGESNRTYQVLSSSDFITWSNRLTTNTTSGSFEFIESASPPPANQYYRSRVGSTP